MNQHLRQLEALQEARKAWEESEWVLRFLRSISSTDKPQPTDQEVLQWYQAISNRQ